MAQAGRAPPIALPQPNTDGPVALERATERRRSVRDFADMPLTLEHLGQLLWAAQGENRHGRGRTTPSAGALYPLEVYVVAGAVEDLAPGVYQYRPESHDLVSAAEGDRRELIGRVAVRQTWMAQAPVILAICAVYRRTTGKYGERGLRYVHMEVGAAAEHVYLQAAALGLGATFVGAFADDQVARALRVPRDHEPLALLPVGRPR